MLRLTQISSLLYLAAEQRRRNDLQDSFRRLSDVLPLSSERTSKKAILDRGQSIHPRAYSSKPTTHRSAATWIKLTSSPVYLAAVSTIADLQDANQALVKKLASYEERSPGGLSSTR